MPAGDGDAEAAAEVGEASLLRAGLDSKVQSCDGAAGESPLHPSFVSCSAQALDAGATGVVGAASSTAAPVTCLLFKS